MGSLFGMKKFWKWVVLMVVQVIMFMLLYFTTKKLKYICDIVMYNKTYIVYEIS